MSVAARTLMHSMGLGRALAAGIGQLAWSRQLAGYLRRFRHSRGMLQLNLFLALPELRGSRRLAAMARRVAWHRLYNDLDFSALAWNRFQVLGRRHLETALERGRGALLCTQHLGPYRRLFYELLRQGLDVHLLVDAKVAGTFQASAAAQLRRQGLDDSQIDRRLSRLEVMNAEAPGSVRQMLQALRANHVVLVYLDGNTGVEAPGSAAQAHANNVEVAFFGHPITVRRGVCQIARATGAALLPVFAHWEAVHQPVMRFHGPVAPRDGESTEAFCRRGMQELFRQSEEAIRCRPGQYEEWVHVHRWRVAKPAGEVPSEAAGLWSQDGPPAADPRRFRIDPDRAAVLQVGQRDLLVDGGECRVLQTDPLTRQLVRRLRRGASLTPLIDGLAGRGKGRPSRQHVMEVLEGLHGLGILEEVQSGSEVRNGI